MLFIGKPSITGLFSMAMLNNHAEGISQLNMIMRVDWNLSKERPRRMSHDESRNPGGLKLKRL